MQAPWRQGGQQYEQVLPRSPLVGSCPSTNNVRVTLFMVRGVRLVVGGLHRSRSSAIFVQTPRFAQRWFRVTEQGENDPPTNLVMPI